MRGILKRDCIIVEAPESFRIVECRWNSLAEDQWSPESLLMTDSGRTPGYLERVSPAFPVDIVIIMLGTNGAAAYQFDRPIDAADYRAALYVLVEHLLRNGAHRVGLMTPPPSMARHDTSYVETIIQESAGSW